MVPVALLSDTAHMRRQLGVESIRASVANLSSMALHPTWTISDLGETNDDSPERPMDSAFPGSADLAQAARKLDLTIGTQHFGQLLLLREPRIEGMELRFDILRLAAGFAFLASALAAAVMAIRWRKSPLPGTPSAPPAVS